MIFKKINEDFDFGSIEVSSSAAESYQQTPEIVRTVTNLAVPLHDVFVCKFQTILPKQVRQHWIYPHMGNIMTDKEIRSNRVKEYTAGFHKPAIKLLEMAGFTKHKISYNVVKNGKFEIDSPDYREIPDALYAAVKDIFEYDGNFSELEELKAVYYISPDNGVLVIDELYCQLSKNAVCENKFARTTTAYGDIWSFRTNMIILYTGEIIYKVSKPSKDETEKVERGIKLITKAKNALCKLFRLNRSTLRPEHVGSPIEINGGKNMIFSYNKPNAEFYIRLAKSHSRNGVMGIIDCSAVSRSWTPVIEKIDVSNTNNIKLATGYTTEDKSLFVYVLTDYTQVVKLLGQDTASQISPTDIRAFLSNSRWGGPFVTVPAYVFVYLNEHSTDIVKSIIKGEIKMKDLV